MVRYVTTELNQRCELVANKDWIREWEMFELISQGNNFYAIKACNNKYVTAELNKASELVANINWIKDWEKFKFTFLGDIEIMPTSQLQQIVNEIKTDKNIKDDKTFIQKLNEIIKVKIKLFGIFEIDVNKALDSFKK